MRVRQERVANAIRREISNIIHNELKDPRIGFTTVTKVEVTSDLRRAKIYYSVLGNEKEKKSTQIALKNATGFMKGLIGDRLKLRLTPELAFVVDKTIEYHDNINKILEKINREKKTSYKEKNEDV